MKWSQKGNGVGNYRESEHPPRRVLEPSLDDRAPSFRLIAG